MSEREGTKRKVQQVSWGADWDDDTEAVDNFVSASLKCRKENGDELNISIDEAETEDENTNNNGDDNYTNYGSSFDSGYNWNTNRDEDLDKMCASVNEAAQRVEKCIEKQLETLKELQSIIKKLQRNIRR